MANPPAYRTLPDTRIALEAQKRAFEEWQPFKWGKGVMFFPTFTNPATIPDKPEGAIVVGRLDEEPGMFWVHDKAAELAVKKAMAAGTWPRLLGIIHPITDEDAHEFTKIVAAFDPITGEEWESVAAKDMPWSLELQRLEIQKHFPSAIVVALTVEEYNKRKANVRKDKGS